MALSAKGPVCALVLGALAALVASPGASADRLDAHALQMRFATAEDLALVSRVRDLPAEVRLKLDHLPWLQQRGLADFGADWAAGDAPGPDQPLGQHLFSGVSAELIAVVFQTHGHAPHVRVLLAPRHSLEYCLFELPPQTLASIRLSEIQLLIRPDRSDTAYRKVPTCQRESTAEAFQGR